MNEFKFEVLWKPLSKARPRFYRRGKFTGVYNSQKKEEGMFALEAFEEFVKVGGKKTAKPVHVDVSFHLKRPKNHYGTGKNSGVLKSSAPIEHITKPDIDNLLKFVLDCLNKVIWYDDSQVVLVSCRKQYSDVEKTLLVIGEK